ncbi:carbonate dehydratase [Ramicandelaber brevisporus]|nr:carbonate dehydratase [Ramicandelaber brevisporus]
MASPSSKLAVVTAETTQTRLYTGGRLLKHEEIPRLLLESNKQWAESVQNASPTAFSQLSKGQEPRVLWIGCADSRTSPNTLLGGAPMGELFIHRNIANVVSPNDLSSMSVLTYAVEYLGVDHIVVAGHTCCGGIRGAIAKQPLGILDHWLAPVRQLIHTHKHELDAESCEEKKEKKVIDLNVINGVRALAGTEVVQKAWKNGKKLTLHAWVFHIETGRLEDLGHSISSVEQVAEPFKYDLPSSK